MAVNVLCRHHRLDMFLLGVVIQKFCVAVQLLYIGEFYKTKTPQAASLLL